MSEYARYVEISNHIREKIINNFYKSGQILPSEKQLCNEYKVSRRTIRKAIQKMVEEGFLYTVPGKGTIVHLQAKNKYHLDLSVESFLMNGYEVAELYRAKIQNPNIEQVYNLQVAPKEKIFLGQWILKRKEKIVAFDKKIIPYFPGIPINETDLSYKTLGEMLGKKFSQFEMQEKVNVYGVIASENICKIMGLDSKISNSVMCVDTKIYDNDMMPLGWNELYVRSDECEIKGELIGYDG